jgi:hypothetical protein
MSSTARQERTERRSRLLVLIHRATEEHRPPDPTARRVRELMGEDHT